MLIEQLDLWESWTSTTTVDNRVLLSTKHEYRLNSDTLFKVIT
jgi:hypothetical protein